MAYEPTNWKTGDVVTSAKLNKLENAVANSGILAVHVSDNVLDKTWQELLDAISSGILCIIFGSNGSEANANIITDVYADDGEYSVVCGESNLYSADSSNGYPVYIGGR